MAVDVSTGVPFFVSELSVRPVAIIISRTNIYYIPLRLLLLLLLLLASLPRVVVVTIIIIIIAAAAIAVVL